MFYYATLKSIEQYVAYDFGLKSSVVVRINFVSLDLPRGEVCDGKNSTFELLSSCIAFAIDSN